MNKYLGLVFITLSVLGYFQYRLGDQMSLKVAGDRQNERPQYETDQNALSGTISMSSIV